MNKKLLLGLIAVITLGSCTIQKRQYMGGYHVEWHKPIAKKSKKVDENFSQKQAIQENNAQLVTNDGNSEDQNVWVETNYAMAQKEELKKVNLRNEKNQKENLKTNVVENQPIQITKKQIKQRKETAKEIRKEIKKQIKKEKKKSAGSLHRHLKTAILLFAIGLIVWFFGFFLFPFFFLAYLLFLASFIFFLLWLVEELG